MAQVRVVDGGWGAQCALRCACRRPQNVACTCAATPTRHPPGRATAGCPARQTRRPAQNAPPSPGSAGWLHRRTQHAPISTVRPGLIISSPGQVPRWPLAPSVRCADPYLSRDHNTSHGTHTGPHPQGRSSTAQSATARAPTPGHTCVDRRQRRPPGQQPALGPPPPAGRRAAARWKSRQWPPDPGGGAAAGR